MKATVEILNSGFYLRIGMLEFVEMLKMCRIVRKFLVAVITIVWLAPSPAIILIRKFEADGASEKADEAFCL